MTALMSVPSPFAVKAGWIYRFYRTREAIFPDLEPQMLATQAFKSLTNLNKAIIALNPCLVELWGCSNAHICRTSSAEPENLQFKLRYPKKHGGLS